MDKILTILSERFALNYSNQLGGNTAIDPKMIEIFLDIAVTLFKACSKSGAGGGGGGLGDDPSAYISAAKNRPRLARFAVGRKVRQALGYRNPNVDKFTTAFLNTVIETPVEEAQQFVQQVINTVDY